MLSNTYNRILFFYLKYRKTFFNDHAYRIFIVAFSNN